MHRKRERKEGRVVVVAGPKQPELMEPGGKERRRVGHRILPVRRGWHRGWRRYWVLTGRLHR